MFTNHMLESKKEHITLSDIDERSVEEIVNFAYTGEISIHEDNVQHLLKASSILQLSDIVAACCTFLKGQLHATNCLGIATFAQAHGCTSLGDRAMEYVHDKFSEVVEGEEFVQLNLENLTALLSSDFIQVESEEHVFEAMYKWLQYDLPSRKQHALSLLRCVRLPLLNPFYLSDAVYSKDVLKQDPTCMHEIMNALVYVSVKEKRLHLKDKVNCKPRMSTLGTMFVVGGIDTGRNKVSIEAFDARKECWVLLGNSQLTFKRLQFGVAVLDSHVYVVGGRNGLQTLNTVDCFDPVTNSWLPVPPMCSYRHGVSVATLCGPLYAVGGHDGWSYLSSVERYDPSTKQWSHITSMSSPRSTAGVAILEGKLYVVGGRDSNSCLNTMECYDPHTDRWTALPSMRVRRGGVGVVVISGKLYAIGGHEVLAPLNSVEVYDPKTNEWSWSAPMLCARDAVAAVTFGGKIYVVGGFNGDTYLDSVECLDPELSEWTMVSGLSCGRAGAGVVVMDFPLEKLLHGYTAH
jgi:kelch-like protein 1/4/5